VGKVFHIFREVIRDFCEKSFHFRVSQNNRKLRIVSTYRSFTSFDEIWLKNCIFIPLLLVFTAFSCPKSQPSVRRQKLVGLIKKDGCWVEWIGKTRKIESKIR